MTRVLLHTNDPETAQAIVERAHPDLRPGICTTYDGLADAVTDQQPEVVYTCRFEPAEFPRAALFTARSVRWISNAGSGCNHLMPWDPARVVVTNGAGVAAQAMAEYGLAAMLHFAMDVPGLLADQAARRWQPRTVAPLAGRTLLCVGLGQTGQRMAQIAAPLGMHVLGVRASGKPTPPCAAVWTPDDLAEPLSQADFVFICLPLTDASRGMFTAATFAAMKPSAVLVDLSRGGIVDQSALIRALDARHLRGAALDVFETEPLPHGSALWHRPDVLVSPHCSGVYDGWEREALRRFAENLSRWRQNQPLQNVVDPHRGY